MTRKKRRTTVPAGRGRVVVFGGEPKMSEVILDLADPLLDGDVSNPKEVAFIVQLTIATWNKAMSPADRQAAMEKQIIDTLVPLDGDAESVAAIVQAMEIVDDRRKKLFPNLRRFVVDYDLNVSEGRVALNIVSAPGSDASPITTKPLSPKDRDDRIRMVFCLTSNDPFPEVNDETLATYRDYLAKSLTFPFQAEHGGEYGHPERVKVIGLGGADEEPMIDKTCGILCEARMEGRVVTLPLGELEDAKPNRRLIDDYCYWFRNWG